MILPVLHPQWDSMAEQGFKPVHYTTLDMTLKERGMWYMSQCSIGQTHDLHAAFQNNLMIIENNIIRPKICHYLFSV